MLSARIIEYVLKLFKALVTRGDLLGLFVLEGSGLDKLNFWLYADLATAWIW